MKSISITNVTKLEDYEAWLKANPEHPDYALMLKEYQTLKAQENDN